jgi:hypothetical protein
MPRWVVALVLGWACGRHSEPSPAPDTGATPPATADPAREDASTDVADRVARRFIKGPLPAEAPFEGVVSLQVVLVGEANRPPVRHTFVMKGKKLRWDLFSEGGKGAEVAYRIYDGTQHKFFTVPPGRPVVYATSAAVLLADAGAARSYKLSPFAAEPKGAILGMPCARMQTDDERLHYDLCLAEGLPTLPLAVLGKSLEAVVPFSELLDSRGLFPLNIMVRPREPSAHADAAAHAPQLPPHATLKTVKIERGQVSDAAFDLPGYPVVDAPTLAAPQRVR